MLGLTESRICQIHTQICNELRKKLETFEAEYNPADRSHDNKHTSE